MYHYRYGNMKNNRTTVPTSTVHFFRQEIFLTVPGIYSTLPGKSLVFCLCMIPTVSPLQKHGEEHRREATINISAPAATIGSDDLPRRHLLSGVDALRTVAPSRPRRPSPPTAPLSGLATAAARRMIKITVVDAGHQPPTPLSLGQR